MNNISLATKPAQVMRTLTQPIRDYTSTMRRLEEQWFAAVERANATYIDGIKRTAKALEEIEAGENKPSTEETIPTNGADGRNGDA